MAPQYTNPRFHVIIVPWSRTEYFEACLSAVLGQSLPPSEVTVFDNALAGGGVGEIVSRNFRQVRLMRSPVDLGFAGGNNRAAAAVREVHEQSLKQLSKRRLFRAWVKKESQAKTHPRRSMKNSRFVELLSDRIPRQ